MDCTVQVCIDQTAEKPITSVVDVENTSTAKTDQQILP